MRINDSENIKISQINNLRPVKVRLLYISLHSLYTNTGWFLYYKTIFFLEINNFWCQTTKCRRAYMDSNGLSYLVSHDTHRLSLEILISMFQIWEASWNSSFFLFWFVNYRISLFIKLLFFGPESQNFIAIKKHIIFLYYMDRKCR